MGSRLTRRRSKLQKLGGLLEHLLESEIVSDGVLAQDETQLASLWSLRESMPEAAGKLGKVYKYDLSMPVKDMYSLVEEARVRFEEHGLIADGSIKEVVGYGHIGDGECSAFVGGEHLLTLRNRRQPPHQHRRRSLGRED